MTDSHKRAAYCLRMEQYRYDYIVWAAKRDNITVNEFIMRSIDNYVKYLEMKANLAKNLDTPR